MNTTETFDKEAALQRMENIATEIAELDGQFSTQCVTFDRIFTVARGKTKSELLKPSYEAMIAIEAKAAELGAEAYAIYKNPEVNFQLYGRHYWINEKVKGISVGMQYRKDKAWKYFN